MVFFVFTNCQKDDDFTNHTKNANLSEYKISKIGKAKIQANKQLKYKLVKLSESLVSVKQRTENKTVVSSEFDFSINTDYATYIESADATYHSYTFPVYRLYASDTIENLVLSLKANGTYQAMLFKYATTSYEKEIIKSGLYVDLTDKITGLHIEDETFISNIFSKVTTPDFCINYEYGIGSCSYGDTYEHDTAQLPGGGWCGGSTSPIIGASPNYDCIDQMNAGGNGPTSNEGSPGGNNNETGGGGNSNNSDPIITTPTVIQTWQEVVACINGESISGALDNTLLNGIMITELQDSKPLAIQANDYLNENGCSEEAQAFVIEAISAVEQGGLVDWDDNVILDSTVLNNQKVKCVYDKLKGLSNTVFNDIINNHFESAKNANIRFEIGTTPGGEDAITLPYIGNPNDTSSTSNYKIIINLNIVNNLSTIELALIFIHESIHAELIERCFRVGLISSVQMINGVPLGISFTTAPSNSFTTSEAIFSALALNYYNYSGGNSQWNHDLFSVGNYRTTMAQNLVDIHPWLNDASNDFLSNVNNDSLNLYGNFSLQELMEYISWIGLEGTQEFINNIQNNSLEFTKKNYVENVARVKYNNNCN